MKTKSKIRLFETYLAAVRNSVGSRTFRNFYVESGDRKTDAMQDGNLSCAWFVSAILALSGLIKKPHATVASTLADLESSGWQRVVRPEAGSVILWETGFGKDGQHRHLGFYIGNDKAVSNSSRLGKIARHHWTFGSKNGQPKRKVEAIFRHPKLRKI